MVSVSDLEILRLAKVLIKQHDASAVCIAASRADELLDVGDLDGAAVWRRIVKAIEALLALDPTGAIN